MSNLLRKILIWGLLIPLLTVFQLACSPKTFHRRISPLDAQNNPEYTGGLKVIHRDSSKAQTSAYLSPKNEEKFQKAKESVQNTWEKLNIQGPSEDLLQSIQNVSLIKKNSQWVVEFDLKIQKVQFQVPLNSEQNIDKEILSTEGSPYILQPNLSQQALCYDPECTEAEFTIAKKQGEQVLALATVLVVSKKGVIHARSIEKNPQWSSSLLRELFQSFGSHNDQNSTSVTVKDIGIVNGPSYRYVDIENPGLKFRFENHDTQSRFIDIEFLTQNAKGVTGLVMSQRLLEKGWASQLAFENSQNQKEVLFLTLQVQVWDSQIERIEVISPPTPVSDEALTHLNPQQPLRAQSISERARRVVKMLEVYRNPQRYPWVYENINSLLEKRKQGVQNFIANIKSAKWLLDHYAKHYELPTSLAIMLLIESSMFSSDDNTIAKSALGGSCEVGPWQFTYETAKDHRSFFDSDRIYPVIYKGTNYDELKTKCQSVPKDLSHNPQDQRQYLSTATNGAFKYLNNLIDRFPQDPLLAIQAYNSGEGNMEKALNFLKATTSSSVSYETYFKGGHPFDYSLKFISYYLIVTDPESFGLSSQLTGADEVPCDLVYPPNTEERAQCSI